MKRENFISMILGVIGVLFFALGMCMCMISEWDAFNQGIIMGAIGIAALGIIGALVLGVGMCMTMVWQGLMLPGIVVGIVGIVLLLCLIPLCKSLY